MLPTQNPTGIQDFPAPASDSLGTFEQGCIDLLCKQENALSQLRANSKRRPLVSLELARKMLIQFLDFAESHFDAQELRTVAQWLYEVHQRTREFEKMLDAQSCKMLRKMFGAKVPSKEEMESAHLEIRREYLELYKSFFAKCAKRFREDSEKLELFLRSVATFLTELDRKW